MKGFWTRALYTVRRSEPEGQVHPRVNLSSTALFHEEQEQFDRAEFKSSHLASSKILINYRANLM